MIPRPPVPAAVQTSLPSERTSHFLLTNLAFWSLELFGMRVCGCKCVCVSCVYVCTQVGCLGELRLCGTPMGVNV